MDGGVLDSAVLIVVSVGVAASTKELEPIKMLAANRVVWAEIWFLVNFMFYLSISPSTIRNKRV